MREDREGDQLRTGTPGERTGKKPYQKPQFRFERVFETRALSCGKVNPTSLGCKSHKKNS